MFISRRTSLPALHQRKHGRNMIHRSWWPSHQVLECSQCLIWRQTLNHSGNFVLFFWHFIIWNHMILQEAVPSASSILGMSRYFSATSKAVLRLPMGSSCKGRQSQEETQWRINRKTNIYHTSQLNVAKKTVNHIPTWQNFVHSFTS